MEEIEYTRGKSFFEQIKKHLLACDDFFVPRLSSKIEISLYAEKLTLHAVNFEAWNGVELIGLVSVYVNDLHKRLAFISNVSIISTFAGKGIATALLKESILYAQKLQFDTMGLEVSARNASALQLYLKLGFREMERNDEMVNLQLQIIR